MKKPVFWLTVSFFLIFSPLTLLAEFSFKADLASRYIWRGFDLNPYKKPVLQSEVDYAFGDSGVAINLWASFSFERKEAHEVDFTLSYSREISKNILLKTGVIHYAWHFVEDFRFADDTSQEVFLAAELTEFFLRPSITAFYDFTNGDGLYILFQTEYSLKLLSSVRADFSVSMGYNGGQWLAEGVDPGFSDLNFGYSIPFDIGNLQIAHFAHYTIVLLDAIGRENHIWYGISVAYKKK